MEVKNEITMKFDELKEFIVAVEMNHFRGNNEGKWITKEFDRLIKQVEDCIYLNYKIGDKVITISNYGKHSKEPIHCFSNGTVCTVTKTLNDDVIEIEAKRNDIRTKQKTYTFNVEKYEGE